mmetsp:Transcript_25446/g.46788  ORF Transcript_25446/g.46788 Transcript_25446/m.46788 type:complete len:225 (+) Transcript_25446:1150-1824(+)
MLPRFRNLRSVEPLGLPSATVSASGLSLFASAAFLAAPGDSGTFMMLLLLLLFPFIVTSRRGLDVAEVGKLLSVAPMPPEGMPGIVPAAAAPSIVIALMVASATTPPIGSNGGRTEEGIDAKLASDPIMGGWTNNMGFSGSISSRIERITSVIKLQNCSPCFISVCILLATRTLNVSSLSRSSSFRKVASASSAVDDSPFSVVSFCLKDRARCRFIRCIVDVAF